jgi:hypothetical protein
VEEYKMKGEILTTFKQEADDLIDGLSAVMEERSMNACFCSLVALLAENCVESERVDALPIAIKALQQAVSDLNSEKEDE